MSVQGKRRAFVVDYNPFTKRGCEHVGTDDIGFCLDVIFLNFWAAKFDVMLAALGNVRVKFNEIETAT